MLTLEFRNPSFREMVIFLLGAIVGTITTEVGGGFLTRFLIIVPVYFLILLRIKKV